MEPDEYADVSLRHLRKLIKEGNLEEIKKLTSRCKSKSDLNSNGESAAFTAISNKQFKIYAYLKSIGVHLLENENYFIEYNLSSAEKNQLREILSSYFPIDPETVILYLTAKSKSLNPPTDYKTKVKEYYTKLYEKIPEILEVVLYENDLDIIFDFTSENVTGVYPAGGETDTGLALTREKTIYIGCKTAEKSGTSAHEEDSPWIPEPKVLGILAHELTHLAMEVVFKNQCKPYGTSDGDENVKFEEIKTIIGRNFRNTENRPDQIISNVFLNYRKELQDSELIVRIPQILAEISDGQIWLQDNVPSLLNYYRDFVLPKCKEFISKAFLIKPRKLVRTITEEQGEIDYLRKLNLFFKDVSCLKNNLSKQNISFVIARNIHLGLLRVLQALYEKNYIHTYDNFLVCKFEKCFRPVETENTSFENSFRLLANLKTAFQSEATDSLIINCKSVDSASFKKGTLEILKILGTIKKIVFVAEEEQLKEVKEIRKELDGENKTGLITLAELFLKHFDEDSKSVVLKKRILFQGTEMALDEFCGENIEYTRLISEDVIEKLLGDEKRGIGRNRFGISSLEGSYAKIFQEINAKSLSSELQNPNKIFLFCGGRNEITRELGPLEYQIDEIDPKIYKVTTKYVLLVAENLSGDFKEFCRNNPNKKVYLISMMGNQFILEQIYNPDFYLQRKIRKIVMKPVRNKIEEMIIADDKSPGDDFVFSGQNKLIQNLPIPITNIHMLEASEAKEFLKQSKKTAHWFQAEGEDLLFWKNSTYSVKNIQNYVDEDLCKKYLMDEVELIEEIIEKKVVIIADEPGMGKSTTVTKLYESKLIADNHWIIRVNLKDHVNFLNDIDLDRSKNLINILQNFELDKPYDELNKYFLELMLNPKKEFSKSLLLTFDGYDELLDDKIRKNTINLLKFLKNETKCKIWITSRLYYKTNLEHELGALALQLDPVNDTMKKQFVEKYYKDRLDLLLPEELFHRIFGADEDNKLRKYVDQFVEKLGQIFQGDISGILETPLQLNLLLDNSLEYFKNWVEGRVTHLDFSYLGANIFEVYEKYIGRKYDGYFQKKNILESRSLLKSSIEQAHKNLAISLIANEPHSDEINEHSDVLLLIGLVQLQNQKLQFVHFTFREFYCAEVLVGYLIGDSKEPSDIVKKLLKKVLEKSEHKLVRKFIDGKLQEIEKPIQTIIRQNDFLKPEKYLHTNIWEKNSKLFELLFFCTKINLQKSDYFDIMTLTDRFGHNLLHSAACSGNVQILNILLKKIEDMPDCQKREILLMRSTGYSDDTVLLVAAKRTQCDALNILLNKSKEWLSPADRRDFLTAQNNLKENNLLGAIRQQNPELVKSLLEEAEIILNSEDQQKFFSPDHPLDGNVLLEAVKENNQETVKLMLAEAKKLFSMDVRKNFFLDVINREDDDVIFWAVERGNCEMVEILLQEAENILSAQERKNLLLKKYAEEENILFMAVAKSKPEIVTVLLEEVKKILPLEEVKKFFTAENEWKKNLLFLAIRLNLLEMIKFLLETAKGVLSEEELRQFFTAKNGENENVYFFAQKLGKTEIMNLISKKAEEILFDERQKFFTEDDNQPLESLPQQMVGEPRMINFSQRKIKIPSCKK